MKLKSLIAAAAVLAATIGTTVAPVEAKPMMKRHHMMMRHHMMHSHRMMHPRMMMGHHMMHHRHMMRRM